MAAIKEPDKGSPVPEAYLLKERRVHPRIALKIPVIYRVLDDQEEIKRVLELRKKEKYGHTLDVSLGGLCIVTDQPLREGSILSLEITIPDAPKALKAMAEVVWSSETGGGIRFLTMDENDMETLKTFISKASSKR
jgi:c-di-GMP-binding flagellar brake protein YcgR